MGSLFERFSRNPTPTTRIGAGFPPFPSTGSFSPPSPPRDEPRRSGESGAMAAPFIYCRSSIEGNTEDALLKAAFDGDLARVKGIIKTLGIGTGNRAAVFSYTNKHGSSYNPDDVAPAGPSARRVAATPPPSHTVQQAHAASPSFPRLGRDQVSSPRRPATRQWRPRGCVPATATESTRLGAKTANTAAPRPPVTAQAPRREVTATCATVADQQAARPYPGTMTTLQCVLPGAGTQARDSHTYDPPTPASAELTPC
ncbi:hypothetical protein SETIT_3G040600v2 [Setaria italica]|uniref:Uncharacterized protein n=1 Tax=Setaria italica TaxID=4555 RepID=A0A368QB46_SETIT|nr:uncharacterized protein LOC101754035 [Setaria italica]RCV15217.1 hypothetical protein SETIT_3G040600v2 [Setaria italica]